MEAGRPALGKTVFGLVNSIVGPAVSRGVGSPLPLGVGLVVLETTGRRTGRPRTVPLLAARVGPELIVSTVRRQSHWVKNLEADESPRVRLWGRTRPAQAQVRRGRLTTARIHFGSCTGDSPDEAG